MNTTTLLEDIKSIMLKQLNDPDGTRAFFDEGYLQELMNQEKNYREMLVREQKAIELNPLMTTDYSFQVFLTPSARTGGEWQVTIFKKGEPLGHKEYETFAEAVDDNLTEWFILGMWCWGMRME